jgi:membrane protein DedA with SNARE-associated domain
VIDLLSAAVAHAASSPKPLPGAFQSFEPTLRHYGYFAVGGILFLENIGLPLPGETILIAASLYAATGRLNIVLVGVIAVIASTAGSAVGYAVGEYGGRPIAEKYGKYVFLNEERLDKTQAFFERRGWAVVLLGRFVEGVRQAAGIIAGISNMRFRVFLTYTLIGACLWVTTWAIVGELAGDHITTISKYATYVAVSIVVLIIAVLIRALIRSRRKRAVAVADGSAELSSADAPVADQLSSDP